MVHRFVAIVSVCEGSQDVPLVCVCRSTLRWLEGFDDGQPWQPIQLTGKYVFGYFSFLFLLFPGQGGFLPVKGPYRNLCDTRVDAGVVP